MKFKNILNYANIVYEFKEKINKITRKNKNAKIYPITAIKLLIAGFMCQNRSIHEIIQTSSMYKNMFSKKERIPETHGLRDCIMDIPVEQIEDLNDTMIDKLKENKFFRNNLIDGLCVCAVDGVEVFSTNKKIEGLAERNHRDGHVSRYYKALGVMNIGEKTNILLKLEPLKLQDVSDNIKKDEEKIKAEGEITVLKRILPELEKDVGRVMDVIVGDALFANAPILNAIKDINKDAVIRIKDERREILKDAMGLFSVTEPKQEFEEVEIIEIRKIKYSKNSKKKNVTKTKVKTITREITDKAIGEKNKISEKTAIHPKKEVTIIIYEKVTKQVKAWDEEFEMEGYNYGNVRLIKYEETFKNNDVKTMYVLTTLLDYPLDTILKIMHKRWNIENNGFRVLKNRYHLAHCYIGEVNATSVILQLIMYVFNLMNLYFEVRTREFKESKITYIVLSKMLLDEIRSTRRLYDLLEY